MTSMGCYEALRNICRIAKLHVLAPHPQKSAMRPAHLLPVCHCDVVVLYLKAKRSDLAGDARIGEQKERIAVMVTCASLLMTQETGTEFGF